MVRLGGRFAMVPTGSGEIVSGTFRAIRRQLCLRPLIHLPAPTAAKL